MTDTTDRLKALYRECREPNWDGHGAEPITPETLELARQFCDALPADVLEPEVETSHDGSIGLGWNDLAVWLRGDSRLAMVTRHGKAVYCPPAELNDKLLAMIREAQR